VYVRVSGHHPVPDEVVTLLEELRRQGVASMLVVEPTLVHGFLRASPFVRRAREALVATALAAGQALRRLDH